MRDDSFSQNKIAIIYDFDGTLSPLPMQEYTILPELGIKPQDFWDDVNKEADDTESEPMLVYMRLLIEKAIEKNSPLNRQSLMDLAKKIEYFPGVETWFKRVNSFVSDVSQGQVQIEHYIISAGMKEILDGVSINREFENIFASEYQYDENGTAIFPKQLITDTTKTQFLFRINKNKQKLSESINMHTPEYERPIPFSNMIYIGDGMTDVPGMTVTKQGGGRSIAVYNEGSSKSFTSCKSLLRAGRVDFIAQADYSKGSILDRRMKLLLNSVIASIKFEEELHYCRLENNLLHSDSTL